MESLILLATPIVVSIITEAVKALHRIRFSARKATILRFTALTFSFVGSVLAGWLAGDSIPVDEITTYANAFVAFIATQVPYIYGKYAGRRKGV